MVEYENQDIQKSLQFLYDFLRTRSPEEKTMVKDLLGAIVSDISRWQKWSLGFYARRLDLSSEEGVQQMQELLGNSVASSMSKWSLSILEGPQATRPTNSLPFPPLDLEENESV